VTAGFPQTCEQCHDTVLWTDAVFNHATTGFTLSGAHAVPPLQCASCHINGNYNITTAACVSCHLKDYQGATNPNHVQAGFPQTCEQCHDTVLWTDAVFNHATTGFALTGAHTVPPLQCASCHINGNYNITSAACVNCHQTDYNNALTPVNHIAAGFPTTCELCHDTVLWTDGIFNHNNTPFPLTGMHTAPPRLCADCHVNNNYTTLPTTCVGCHQTDYNNTTNPGHAAQPQFFPTTCQTCHNTTNWLNATFNHAQYTQFPINHGNANGVCSTCHINSNDYSVFQCTNCHAKAQTDQNHQGINGYVYNSVNCYQCHRNGGGG
jgi:predicted CXXCH cytochrome family protein